jgi:hypothetical protein
MTAQLAAPLTGTDACLLAAVTESWRRRPIGLGDLIANYDWLDRSIPTFDEVSFGLPRLVAAGFVDVEKLEAGEIKVRATRKAQALRATIKVHTLGGVLAEMSAAVGAPPYGHHETEDRSLGRLVGFEASAWDDEVLAYQESWGKASPKLFAGLGAAVSIIVVVAVARSRLGRRRRDR